MVYFHYKRYISIIFDRKTVFIYSRLKINEVTFILGILNVYIWMTFFDTPAIHPLYH